MASSPLKLTVNLPKEFNRSAEMFPAAGAAVLNRTATEVRTQVKKHIVDNYRVKASEITSVGIRRATRNNLKAVVEFSRKYLPPSLFVVNRTPTTRRQPVVIEVKKGVRKTLSPNWFFQRGRKSGKMHVMEQEDPKNREHLTLMRYFSLAGLMQSRELLQKVKDFSLDRIQKELPRVIRVFREQGKI